MTAPTPRRTATVGDVVKRYEDGGLVTFWRLQEERWTVMADSILVQVLCARTMWPKLTPRQRDILHSCRRERTADEPGPTHHIIDPQLPDLPAGTLASLQRKGIADSHGMLTWEGVYTALWGGDR